MSALEIIRKKKFDREPLMAWEEIILDAYYNAKDNNNLGRILLAETAANEVAHMAERIKEHLPK